MPPITVVPNRAHLNDDAAKLLRIRVDGAWIKIPPESNCFVVRSLPLGEARPSGYDSYAHAGPFFVISTYPPTSAERDVPADALVTWYRLADITAFEIAADPEEPPAPDESDDPEASLV